MTLRYWTNQQVNMQSALGSAQTITGITVSDGGMQYQTLKPPTVKFVYPAGWVGTPAGRIGGICAVAARAPGACAPGACAPAGRVASPCP